ncbi:MAG TPA: AAA family ATPase [Acidimicrobiales bacterium]|jgi:chromosome segregation ATPase|nr:AAA family ATPase [Acidimicrobiales bacterium]
MRIHRIRLRNYRGVDEHEVVFPAAGVTVVQGDNEVGKSSLAEALDLLFDYQDSSTHKAVKATKPVHKDVGTEVEAEIEAGPYRFTYTKRFHREKATVLRVTAPRPESHTGREAHERVLAILDQAVDMPLWRALRLHQGVRPDQADLSEQTSLAAALDTASAGALAGDREAGLVELAKAEYDRFFTATGRPNARLVDLGKAEADVADRADSLRRRLADMDQDAEHAASLVTRIAELLDEVDEQRQRVADYDAKWRAVDTLLRDVETARAKADAADAEHRAALEDLSRRQAMVEAVERAERRHRELAAEHDRHRPALDAAKADLETAEQRLTAAAAAAGSADQALRDSQADFTYARDSFDLATMTERLGRVLEAQAALARLDAALDEIRVGPAELEAIEDAHLAVVQARARVEVESPVVEVEALRATRVRIGETVHPLEAGQTAAGPVVTLVEAGEDLARLAVRAGREGAQSAAALAQAEQALAGLCAAAGVADVAEAKAAAAGRRDAARERDTLVARLHDDLRDLTPDRLAGKVDRLRARLDQVRLTRPGPRAEPLDFDTARRGAEEAEARAGGARDVMREAEGEVARKQQALARLQGQAELAEREVELARRQVETARADLDADRFKTPDGVLAGRVEETAKRLSQAEAAAQQAEAAADKARPDDLRLALDNANKVLEKLVAEQQGAKDTCTAIRAKLAVLGEQGLHDRLAEAEAEAEQRGRERKAAERRAAAAKRLYETLGRCRAEARQAYVAPLQAKIEGFGRIVFGDDFSVELADDLRIRRRTTGGVTVDFDQLSMGAREQLCVISRLACAAIVAADGGVPVILDDALGWSDGRRLEKLGAVLALAAQQAQVIVLTCLPERYRHVGSANVIRLG